VRAGSGCFGDSSLCLLAVRTLSPTIPALADRLRTVLTRSARRLRQEASDGLPPTLTAMLGTIERHGPLTPSEIATRERVQRPTATRSIARLEELGLIDRTSVPGDARSCLLTVSADGAARLKEIRSRKDAFLAQRLRALPAEDRATLARAADLLEQLLQDGERS
jgi:DNA-binding MarR family transcriptional regulator